MRSRYRRRDRSAGLRSGRFDKSSIHAGSDAPADRVEAIYWYSLAAKSGDKAAEAFRNIARRKLNAEQLKEAERRLALFEKKNATQPSAGSPSKK